MMIWKNLTVKNKILACYIMPVLLIILFTVQAVKISQYVSETIGDAVIELKKMDGSDVMLELIGRMQGVDSAVNNLESQILVISLVFIAGALVGVVLLVNSISKPVIDSVWMANKIAKGNLDVWLGKNISTDECGNLQLAIKDMADSLKKIVKQISILSTKVAESSKNVWGTTDKIQAAIDNQAGYINESSQATSQVSDTILNVVTNANDVAEAAGESVMVAGEGKLVVDRTVSSILNIAGNVEKSTKTVEELGEGSKKIGAIISVINDIANQTNLLALNAAIEAARAGEQGRGFAVVADEVRKLAEKTGHATSEITEMITKIQHDTEESVNSMLQNKEESEEGVMLGEKAKESLDKIVAASERCKSLVLSISSSAEEQASAVEQVSTSVSGIAGSFQESRDAISDIVSSTKELNIVSQELMNLVAWFNTGSDAPYAGTKKSP
ncbi:MAG: methyl-accepting chemotaxis protein [Nitrospira sp.]|nr:methyl-accepting chemotaxis protein [bacterium]MBL7049815.1 methyl-accepting chemotaxis protein [Nitrospira sp.]